MTTSPLARLIWARDLSLNEQAERYLLARSLSRMTVALAIGTLVLGLMLDWVWGTSYTRTISLAGTLFALGLLVFHPSPLHDPQGNRIAAPEIDGLAAMGDVARRNRIIDRGTWLAVLHFGFMFALAYVGMARSWFGAAIFLFSVIPLKFEIDWRMS
jgi:hypothetical protein